MKSPQHLPYVLLVLLSILSSSTQAEEQSITADLANAYSVRNFGAKGDGVTLDTKAIQQAIDHCSQGGGGTVLLDRGDFLSGTIFLRSNVNLHIAAGARLLASPNIKDYVTDGSTYHNRYAGENMMNPCFIFAKDVQNITLSGRGQINGNGTRFPNPEDQYHYRPMLIRLLNCQDIHLQDLKFYDPAGWTTAIMDCESIWCRGLDIRALVNGNGDGLSFDNCHHVFVSDCRIQGNDDNIVLIASRKDRGTRYVTINNCNLLSKCANIRVGFMSVGDVQDVAVSNCVFQDTEREGFKIQSCEGGVLRNMVFQNIVMKNVRRPAFVNLSYGKITRDAHLDGDPTPGRVEGLTFQNIRVIDTEAMLKWKLDSQKFEGVTLDASDGTTMKDIVFDSFSYEVQGGVKAAEAPFGGYPRMGKGFWHVPMEDNGSYNPALGFFMRNVAGVTLRNLQFNVLTADERPLLIADTARDVTIAGLRVNAENAKGPLVLLKTVTGAWIEGVRPTGAAERLVEVRENVSDVVLTQNDMRGIKKICTDQTGRTVKHGINLRNNLLQ